MVSFVSKKTPFLANIGCCPNFLDALPSHNEYFCSITQKIVGTVKCFFNKTTTETLLENHRRSFLDIEDKTFQNEISDKMRLI